MKIWIDILTPKQVLFLYPLSKRLKNEGHEVYITSRNYREAIGLIKLRNYKDITIIGKHGGGGKYDKLIQGQYRILELSRLIDGLKPDLCISFCSPDASRVAFGLGIKHIGFCNASHSEKVLRLCVPLLYKLLTPNHIPKDEYVSYGIRAKDIIQYKAYDEAVIIRDDSFVGVGITDKKPIVLVRGGETQASYTVKEFNFREMIRRLAMQITNAQIVVLPRYDGDYEYLVKYLPENVIVLKDVMDSKALLESVSVFVGSGGTMTSEAVLRNIPAISFNQVENADERWLVAKGYLRREESYQGIIRTVSEYLQHPPEKNTLLDEMEDPFDKLLKLIS